MDIVHFESLAKISPTVSLIFGTSVAACRHCSCPQKFGHRSLSGHVLFIVGFTKSLCFLITTALRGGGWWFDRSWQWAVANKKLMLVDDEFGIKNDPIFMGDYHPWRSMKIEKFQGRLDFDPEILLGSKSKSRFLLDRVYFFVCSHTNYR